MTATDELRALLDARGVEWSERASAFRRETFWKGAGNVPCRVTERAEGGPLVLKMHVIPKEAVDATLGRGTCTMDHEDGNDTWWSCSVCDADVYLPTKPKFCWNCGREVVE